MTEYLGPQGDWSDPTHCRYNPTLSWDIADECGKPCSLHVRLSREAFIGACAEHASIALGLPHLDHHEWGLFCNMPGSTWYPGNPGHCDLDATAEEPKLVGVAEAT